MVLSSGDLQVATIQNKQSGLQTATTSNRVIARFAKQIEAISIVTAAVRDKNVPPIADFIVSR
ncbi:hypothetical protein MYX76_17035 [Desulfobacterota bacterium AH_259_B03_O07]|nr:hypothetical protein [Desulfobacterota bacterium AH_259_B03_O07]